MRTSRMLAVLWVGLLAGTAVPAFCLALLSDGLRPWHTPVALVFGAAVAGLAAWQCRDIPDSGARSGPGWLEWFGGLAFFCWAFVGFFWLTFQQHSSIKITNPNNLGDLALHITIIRWLPNAPSFWPESPIIAASPLAYPIGIHHFHALFEMAGVPLYSMLAAVGFLGAMATYFALRGWGGWFAVAGFLFNGGLAGVAFFWTWQVADYQLEPAWKSICTSMLIPQRGFLYAFPAGILLLSELRARMRGTSFLPAWFSLLILGAMPYFHGHTTMFFGGLLVFLAMFSSGTARRTVLVAILSVLPAWGVFFAFVTGFFSTRENTFLWQPGWMESGEGLWFWIVNFGILLPLVTAYVVMLALALSRGIESEKNMVVALFVAPAVLCFVFTCFVVVSPWEWDNTKLMVWCYIAVLPFLREWLAEKFSAFERTLITLLLFFSGFISMLGAHTTGRISWELIQRPEIYAVQKMLEKIPPEERIATVPNFDHPVLLLGRSSSLGYASHLWSHGVSHHSQMADVDLLMNGEEGWKDAAKRLGVRYLYWGLREIDEFENSKRPWRSNPVASSKWGNIYKLDLSDEPNPANAKPDNSGAQ